MYSKIYQEVFMSLKLKLMSVIFLLLFAVIVIISAYTLAKPDRDMMVSTALFVVVMLAAAMVITFLFARSITRQIVGAANTLKDISEGEGDFGRRITGNSKDGMGVPVGTVTEIQSATTTLVKNNVSVIGLIESYEEGLSGMQDVVDDLRDIVHSIDNVLQKSDAIDPGGRVVA